MYNLCKGYGQETIISAFSFVSSFYTKLKMNLTLCAVYCGLMRQHSQAVVWTVSSTYMNGNWRILLLLDTLYFSKDIASNVTVKIVDDYLIGPICDSELSE
jgi:hypothetical protein